MGLTCCDAGDFDPSGCDWFWWTPSDPKFETLVVTRRKRCCSCGILIPQASDVLKFPRQRLPLTEIEEDIVGYDEYVDLAPWYMCEDCGGLAMALMEQGFCFELGDDMREDVKQYAAFQQGHRFE